MAHPTRATARSHDCHLLPPAPWMCLNQAQLLPKTSPGCVAGVWQSQCYRGLASYARQLQQDSGTCQMSQPAGAPLQEKPQSPHAPSQLEEVKTQELVGPPPLDHKRIRCLSCQKTYCQTKSIQARSKSSAALAASKHAPSLTQCAACKSFQAPVQETAKCGAKTCRIRHVKSAKMGGCSKSWHCNRFNCHSQKPLVLALPAGVVVVVV